jgi:hypothetical protein
MLRLLPLLCLLAACSTNESRWKPAPGPLQSIHAKDLDPDAPLPEHPRPQLVRERWLNLNGLWQFQPGIAGEAPPSDIDLSGTILVPFPIESQLSGVGAKHERAWYRRVFEVPTAWRGERVLLHFGAVDWETRAWVNGRAVGEHRGGYDPFTFDITDALDNGDEQELVVAVWDPTDKGDQPRGKQVDKPGGIYYTSVTGIWQTAWLECAPATRLEQIVVHGDPRDGRVQARATIAGPGKGLELELVAKDAGKEVARAKGPADQPLVFVVPGAKPWSPSSPHLYDLEARLLRKGAVLDEALSYFALRTIELAAGTGGAPRLYLNGAELFQIGPLDQGFWPEGLYTAPTDAALRSDLERTKELGFNMLRKHVKVEPARFYRHCDELGLLVWQDMPNGDNKTEEGRRQFQRELEAMVRALAPFPSIVCWVVYNEGWGQHDTPRMVEFTRSLDATRLVSNASGWVDHQVGDLMDIHAYPGPGAPKIEARRAGVLGEFGGIGLALTGHTWQQENWGYEGAADRAALTTRYVDLLRGVHELRLEAGLAAAVYTQTTDVETETNGLLTYDRAVVKMDPARVRAANEGRFPRLVPLVPTSRSEPQDWQVRFEAPQGEWWKQDHDARDWVRAPGGFGTRGTPNAVVETEWKTTEIWLRREFELADDATGDLSLSVHHDEDATIWIDGVEVARLKGYTTAYRSVPLAAEHAKLLAKGRHVIAVHCRQTGGGQCIDVGIDRAEAP